MCHFHVKLKIFERCNFVVSKHFKTILQGSARNLLQIEMGNMYLNHRKTNKEAPNAISLKKISTL